MRIKVQEALKKEIKPGKIFIYGSEEYLTRQLLKKCLRGVKHRVFFPDFLGEFLSFTGSSLFEGELIPVILHGEELPAKLKKKTEREAFLRKLESLDSFVVAVFRELDWKALKTGIFKEIAEISEMVIESEPFSEKQIYGIISKKFRSAGRELPPGLIKLIVEIVGTDLTELKHETDKLLLYPGELTEETVRALLFSGGKVNPFELVFPLVEGKTGEFLERALELLAKGSDPLQIIGLLQSQVRNMVEIASGRSVKLPKDALLKYRQSTKKTGLNRLLKILKELHLAEFSIKTGTRDGKEALVALAIKGKNGN